jgi:glutathione S-transferase
VLRERPFLAGETFTMPDITLFASLVFAAATGLPIAPELTALAAWRARVEELPAVKERTGQTLLPEDLARLSA